MKYQSDFLNFKLSTLLLDTASGRANTGNVVVAVIRNTIFVEAGLTVYVRIKTRLQ